MDPNETRDLMLRLAGRLMEALENERRVDEDEVMALAEAVTNPDGWITSGGFLPRAWERKEEK